jgi:hypothetical protein
MISWFLRGSFLVGFFASHNRFTAESKCVCFFFFPFFIFRILFGAKRGKIEHSIKQSRTLTRYKYISRYGNRGYTSFGTSLGKKIRHMTSHDHTALTPGFFHFFSFFLLLHTFVLLFLPIVCLFYFLKTLDY